MTSIIIDISIALCCWFCAALFCGFGIYALKIKKPIHFYSGSTVSETEITDITAYNKRNSLMWFIYGLCFFMVGVIGLLGHWLLAIILTSALCIIGIPILIYIYRKIHSKFHVHTLFEMEGKQ